MGPPLKAGPAATITDLAGPPHPPTPAATTTDLALDCSDLRLSLSPDVMGLGLGLATSVLQVMWHEVA